jgi:hypothetical protein
MKCSRLVAIALSLSILAIAAFSDAEQKAGPQKAGEPKVTFTGKISYMKSVDAYIVKGENPPENCFVVNPNKKVLEALYKNQKTVTVVGHYTVGADQLFIEKIDGKPYKGTAK